MLENLLPIVYMPGECNLDINTDYTVLYLSDAEHSICKVTKQSFSSWCSICEITYRSWWSYSIY